MTSNSWHSGRNWRHIKTSEPCPKVYSSKLIIICRMHWTCFDDSRDVWGTSRISLVWSCLSSVMPNIVGFLHRHGDHPRSDVLWRRHVSWRLFLSSWHSRRTCVSCAQYSLHTLQNLKPDSSTFRAIFWYRRAHCSYNSQNWYQKNHRCQMAWHTLLRLDAIFLVPDYDSKLLTVRDDRQVGWSRRLILEHFINFCII